MNKSIVYQYILYIFVPTEKQNIMKNLKEMISNSEKFAIVKYFKGMRGVSEVVSVYELIKENTRGEVKSFELSMTDIKLFKLNRDSFDLVIDNKDGKVWEMNKFKESVSSKSRFKIKETLKY